VPFRIVGPRDRAVNVYLLTSGADLVFVADAEPADAAAEESGSRGLGGWLARRSRRLSDLLSRSEGAIASRVRRVWQWLQKFVWIDEPLLLRLRTARSIAVHFPAAVSEPAARAAWSDYLASRRRRHLSWAGLDALVAPASVVLAPLPGPNVIGYWFVYRLVCHLLIVIGTRRASSQRVPTDFRALPELDAQGASSAG
jgi:hypothetical protein